MILKILTSQISQNWWLSKAIIIVSNILCFTNILYFVIIQQTCHDSQNPNIADFSQLVVE